MNISKLKFDNSIDIVALGDSHYGDNLCDRAMFKRVVNRIATEKDTYAILTGDLLNVGIAESVTGSYGSETLGDELDEVCEVLKPIKDKIIGFVSSNHHSRVERKTGLSIDKEIASRLGIEYMGHVGILNVVCGSSSYFIAIHHGAGGGRTMGAKANEIKHLEEIVPGCDIYLQGHTHTFQHYVQSSFCINRHRAKVDKVDTHFITTGHYLDYEKGYAAEMKLRPSVKGSAMISLLASSRGCVGVKNVVVTMIDG